MVSFCSRVLDAVASMTLERLSVLSSPRGPRQADIRHCRSGFTEFHAC